ncbi:TolC family protein [Granulicella sp. S156]|uniref:TolC family protein n=1 Tax=Granulicella sp. S156 TaxID=1747224 RepID=UPI00131B84B9|nr:TolC family protein [Granulicella sp. S156]
MKKNLQLDACFSAMLLVMAASAYGQQASSALPAATATQTPIAAPASGGVTTQQSAKPGGSTVDVITPSLQINAPYSGSIPDRSAGEAISLSLTEAIRRGLRFNLGETNNANSVRQARAQQSGAFSALLPKASLSVSESAAKSNLSSEGFSPANFPSFATTFPATVGPYHYYSLQGNLSASVFNLTSLYNYRSAQASAEAASLNAKDGSEMIVLAVSGTYMQVLGTIAEVQAQTDQVRYAQASYDQAAAQEKVGTKAEIDANRSLVQLQTERQRLLSERSDLKKQTFALARLLGLPVNTKITLSSTLNDDPTIGVGEEEAVQQALANRQDLKALSAQVRMAEATVKAAHSEHLPTAAIQGFYGIQGVNPDQGRGVFSASANVSMPIFEGGQIRADIEQAKAALDQRQADLANQQGVVELQVRSAYSDLEVATTQVEVAKSNRDLALKTLKQSQDRFAAGATDTVEVVQSQQTLGQAAQDFVSALYAENLARISLARAMGVAGQQIPTLLKDK